MRISFLTDERDKSTQQRLAGTKGIKFRWWGHIQTWTWLLRSTSLSTWPTLLPASRSVSLHQTAKGSHKGVGFWTRGTPTSLRAIPKTVVWTHSAESTQRLERSLRASRDNARHQPIQGLGQQAAALTKTSSSVPNISKRWITKCKRSAISTCSTRRHKTFTTPKTEQKWRWWTTSGTIQLVWKEVIRTRTCMWSPLWQDNVSRYTSQEDNKKVQNK